MLRSGSSAANKDTDFVPSRRKRGREPVKTYNTRPTTAPLTPPQEEEGSKGSRSSGSTEDESDTCKGPPYPFDEDEVEAASSLATFILAASAACKPGFQQPHSAPASMCKSPTSGEPMTATDVMVYKKQRRREKNRASAQQSRQRKKCHLEALEQRVGELEKDRQALQVKLESLLAENQQLRTQLSTNGPKSTTAEQLASLHASHQQQGSEASGISA